MVELDGQVIVPDFIRDFAEVALDRAMKASIQLSESQWPEPDYVIVGVYDPDRIVGAKILFFNGAKAAFVSPPAEEKASDVVIGAYEADRKKQLPLDCTYFIFTIIDGGELVFKVAI